MTSHHYFRFLIPVITLERRHPPTTRTRGKRCIFIICSHIFRNSFHLSVTGNLTSSVLFLMFRFAINFENFLNYLFVTLRLMWNLPCPHGLTSNNTTKMALYGNNPRTIWCMTSVILRKKNPVLKNVFLHRIYEFQLQNILWIFPAYNIGT